MAEHDLTRREFLATTAATAAAAAAMAATGSLRAAEVDTSKIPSYNEKMEYRRLGKTDMTVSAVCMGGHWKQIERAVPSCARGNSWLEVNLEDPAFKKNRREVLDRCMEVGINYIDACTKEEVVAYAEALKGRRDKMYFGFSWYQEEMRNPAFRTAKALLGTLEKGMKAASLDYVDLWRIVLDERSSRHTQAEMDECLTALQTAHKQGKCRFTGVSSHDRKHIKECIEAHNDILQVVVMPYTAATKELPTDSIFEALKKHQVGFLGIKPFSSYSLFKGNGMADSPTLEEDSRLARLAIRYILANPAVTAPIPGLITPQQVDNMAQAVAEHRKLDLAEAKELQDAMELAWQKLPPGYQWLKEWECV